MNNYEQEFNERINKHLGDSLRKNKICFYIMLAFGLGLLVDLVVLVFCLVGSLEFKLAYLIIEVVLILAYLATTYQFNKQRSAMRRSVVTLAIDIVFEGYNTTFRPREAVQIGDVIDSELCGRRKMFRYRGNSCLRVEVSDSSVLESLEISNIKYEQRDRHSEERQHISHSGEFISIRLRQGVGLLAFINTQPESFKKITFESDRFNKYFKVYAYDEFGAYKLFSPQALDQIAEIGKDRHNRIKAKIDDYRIYVSVMDKDFVAYKPKGSNIDYNDVKNMFEDLDKIKALIQTIQSLG